MSNFSARRSRGRYRAGPGSRIRPSIFGHCTRFGVTILLLFSIALACAALELAQDTIDAFNYYVRTAESQMDPSPGDTGRFLFIDRLPAATRTEIYNELKDGRIVVRLMDTTDHGKRIRIPDGMIHHWAGVAFVKDASLGQVESVLLDYPDYPRIYHPDIRRAQVIAHWDDTYKTMLQFYYASRDMGFDADFDVHLTAEDATHATITAISTRVAQLKNPGEPDSALMPVGQGNGYLWRLNDYWRAEEKDGGVYVQIESIELSRSVPFLLSWAIDPLIHDASRSAVDATLAATRRAVLNLAKPAESTSTQSTAGSTP